MIHHAPSASATQSVSTKWGDDAFPPAEAVDDAGFVVDGTIVNLHYHNVSAAGKSSKYAALVVDVSLARRRKFVGGVETEPEVTAAKASRTGWLNNFDKTAANEHHVAPDALDGAFRDAGAGGNALRNRMCDFTKAEEIHPAIKGRFEFWVTANDAMRLELKKNIAVRVRTQGNTFLCSHIATVDPTTGLSKNFTGGDDLLSTLEGKMARMHVPSSDEDDKKSEGSNEFDWSD